ncbi:MAG: sigma-70 family RNA polymerase sigma factor [Actinomycetota bacterium]|nr:sigma-70 family RNA polymerase sigma factor [Actinomycetota bacterium]
MRSAGETYRVLAPAVLGYLRAQGAPDPEDLLGEVFLQVARDLDRFSGDDEALRRWVFAIAHNRLLDARRRQARRPTVADRDVPDAPVAPPPDPFDPELVAALGMLTADQREVVVLRFVADLPLDDVARITGRTVGAVKALQHRALDALSRMLAARVRDEGVAAPPVS